MLRISSEVVSKAAFAVLVGVSGLALAQQVDRGQVEADRDALVELERQVNELEAPYVSGSASFDDYQKGLERMNRFRTFYESHWPEVETIFRRYGANLNDLWSVPDTLRAAADRVDLSMPNEISGAALTLIQKRETVDKTKKEVARACPDTITTYTNERNLSAVLPMYRTRQIGQALALIDLCPRYDPENENLKNKFERLRSRVEELLQRYHDEQMAQLQTVQWQGHAAGAPANLEGELLSYLRANAEWGGNTKRATQVVKLSVRGSWFVAERDILGRPVRYGLPIHLAIVDSTMQPDFAQVFELSAITAGAKKGGPFLGTWVGNTWQILRARVVGGGEAAGGRSAVKKKRKRR